MIGSIGAGILQQTSGLLLKEFQITLYVWLYNHICLVRFDEQWDLVVWILAFLGVDLAYYWAHRGAHELNIGWAGHVTHHNSQDYNLSTALRQSTIQVFFTTFFYLPLALIIPPPAFALHNMLNLLFQFWIHTEVIPPLGPLEYIINTPSSHRVHHGRNPFCIDKNYAGVLIIWDILFGTYQQEKVDVEPVLYGVTHNINTFNPITIQLHHLKYVLTAAATAKGPVEAFNRVFMGPGWTPERPELRLGDPNDIPRVPNLIQDPDADIGYFNPDLFGFSAEKDPVGAAIVTAYVLLNFAAVVVFQMGVQMQKEVLGWQGIAVAVGICVLVLSGIGELLDGEIEKERVLVFAVGQSVWYLVAWPVLVSYFDGFGVLGDGFLSALVRFYVPVMLCALFWAAVYLKDPEFGSAMAISKEGKEGEHWMWEPSNWIAYCRLEYVCFAGAILTGSWIWTLLGLMIIYA
ncbi:hypothetical protein HDU99_002259 [Rhizoclosmatium hyalinum]|nr:hypothetical protein HDU99_002259 [Rhizoclosmatium hyalinum]